MPETRIVTQTRMNQGLLVLGQGILQNMHMFPL